MLLLSVFAAFWAAENTFEKNPPCVFVPGVKDPFSGVGVSGADVIFESLLGPKAAEFDRTRRCDIILPDGDVTTFGLDEAAGSDAPRSRLVEANLGDSDSVGVGGVLTITGAMLSFAGGVWGRTFVSM
jgi:hypothetical protein